MLRATFIGAAALLGAVGTAHADSNILFILDASNSMWGQVEGRAKIETAKEALSRLLSDLPPGTRAGLMVYGHRSESSCDDVELALPVGEADPARVTDLLDRIRPKGKTPIASSLQSSAAAFTAAMEGSRHVVLISDGIETCEGDPCAAASALAAADIRPRVHVIGFDIGEEERAQLQCIADLGGGQYFSADSTAGFAEAVAEVVEVAQQEPEPAPPPPPPSEPARGVYFLDEFNGDRLAEDWIVHNPDPNAHLVEDGTLLLLSKTVGGFDDPGTANIIELARDLPDGDWDAHVTFNAELKSGRDTFWFGLRGDENNYMAATFYTELGSVASCSSVGLQLLHKSGGNLTQEAIGLYGGKTKGCGSLGPAEYDEAIANLANRPVTLTLSRRGRSYHASLAQSGAASAVSTDSLTSLRPPGRLTLTVGKWKAAHGEVLVLIDSVRIETVE